MEKYKTVIQTSGLAIGYKKGRREEVLNSRLDLSLYPGEVTSLLGVNGAGKSTLLRTLAGFHPSLEGEINILGRDYASIKAKELARMIGVVLTGKTMAGTLTVFDLVALGRHPYTGFFGRLQPEDRHSIGRAMQRSGIEGKANSRIAELSDGERQKAMIAKALAQECPIILLDEPTAFLDVTSRIELMILLRELAVDEGKSILLSTHDIELALALSDRIWLLEKYEGVTCGVPEDLVLNGAVDACFSRGTIRFDNTNGRLGYMVEGTRPAFIEGGAVQRYWLANALKRHGYAVADTPEGALLHIRWSSAGAPIVLLPAGGKEQTFSTVEKMIEAVKLL